MDADRAEDQWPAVRRASDFVLPSYQIAVTRLEAADSRLTLVLGQISTITLAVPAFAKAMRPDIVFATLPFVLAMLCAVTAAVTAILGRVRGQGAVVDPALLYQPAHRESEWEFQRAGRVLR